MEKLLSSVTLHQVQQNAPGTTGCYSNCSIPDLPVAEYPASMGTIAYFLGVDSSSSLLEMDPYFLAEDRIQYAFVNLNSDWLIDNTSLGQDFQNFWGFQTQGLPALVDGISVLIHPLTRFSDKPYN